jgi:transposase InsO family protein
VSGVKRSAPFRRDFKEEILMTQKDALPMRERWARLRFSILGPLLAAPPEQGELKKRLEELSQKSYRHPSNQLSIRFAASTIERWYYEAKDEADPLHALERKVPSHAGTHPSLSAKVAEALSKLYQQHQSWTFQLHYDNLLALAKQNPELGALPSYPTIRRYMKDQGMLRQRKRKRRQPEEPESTTEASETFRPREKRSYEVRHVHQLWHLDFHQGSRKVLTPSGEWKKPQLLGVLDDHSRLCCHLQWYLDETAETLCHGLSQALQKRGLPRSLMTDNGKAMVAAEIQEGLLRLGIVHELTLPYSPEQNGKQECFWGQVEGRLIAMLEGEPELTLSLLNQATQAWVEQEYQRTVHSELRESPLERALRGPSLARPCPGSEELRRAFRMQTSRAQRHSDGTFTVSGVRFEVPSRYRTLIRLSVRITRWDLSCVDLCDPRTGAHLCTVLPLDKAENADAPRRLIQPSPAIGKDPGPPPSGIAPYLLALMQEYSATGLPPAYLPKLSSASADPQPSLDDLQKELS